MNECRFRNASIRRHASAVKTKINPNLAYFAHMDGTTADFGVHKFPLGAHYPEFNTVNQKFGSACLGKCATYQVRSTLLPGSRWTIDFWLFGATYSHDAVSLFSWGITPMSGCIIIQKKVGSANDSARQDILLIFYPNSTPVILRLGPYPENQWAHIAATYDGRMVRAFYNGVLTSAGVLEAPLVSYLQYFSFQLNNTQQMRDEVRIMANECAWISNFTPPSVPYTGYERYIHVT